MDNSFGMAFVFPVEFCLRRRHGNGNSIDIHIYVRIHYEHLKYKILNLYLALPYGEN
jgi:hypothetical protein